MPRWRVLTILVVLSSSSSVAAQGVPMDPREAEVELWTSAVRQHLPGTLDEHDRAVADWPWSRLETAIAILHRRSSTDPALFLRAAALYSDIAFFIPIADRPLYKATPNMLAHDGRPSGRGWLDSHLQVGQTLVARAVRRKNATDETRRDASHWYVAVAAVLAGGLALADLQPHLQQARDTLPDDPAILFLAACMAETFAGPLVQASVADGPRPSRTRPIEMLQTRRFARDANLKDAERDFRQVLELEPSMTEAGVRLGHVLIERGRPAEAVRVLEGAADDTTVDPIVRYYRALFLGRALELTGRAADARVSFERAATLFPRAQSPRLAVSRLAAVAGEVRAAQDAMAVVLSLPAEERVRDDPWWVYYLGPGRNSDAVYAAASARLGRLLAAEPGADK